MKLELPSGRPYGALFAVGFRKSDSDAVEQIGSVIVKAGFLLTNSTGADSHELVPNPNAAASALVLADQGTLGEDGFDVTRENDVAPFKPLSDIVVEGFLADLDAPSGAELRVDGEVWLTRSGPASSDLCADHERNLFGYQPRALAPRDGAAGTLPAGPPSRALRLEDLVGYDNVALNFHRRGDGFTASAAVGPQLSNGQRVTVHKAGTEAFSLTLAIPSLTAMYRTYCGHGPDKAPYWKRHSLGAMRADTVILKPDASRAEVLWRATWPWRAEAVESYRAIRVTEDNN